MPLVMPVCSRYDATDCESSSLAFGAVHGASSLPEEWLGLVHGWPGLRADDLRDLAGRVMQRGVEDLGELGVPDERR